MAISLKFRIALQVFVLFFVATLCVKGQITPPDSTSYLDTLKDEVVTEQVQNKSLTEPTNHMQTILPPSPDATALGKFGNMPVSLYTGTPSVSVPLYTLRGRELSVPISLDYHASGIKVEEVASNVGLGWALNAGGQIVQTIRGGNDRQSSRYQGGSIVCSDFPTPGSNAVVLSVSQHQKLVSGEKDAEPDLFSLSLPGGRSIRFFFDGNSNTRTLHILEHANHLVKITPPSNFFDIHATGNTHWLVTTEEGTKYYFGLYDGNYNLESTSSVTQGSFSKVDNANTTWLLARIENASGTDVINYTYGDYELKYEILSSNELRTHRVPGSSSLSPSSDFYGNTTIHIMGKHITSIKSEREEIYFIHSTERCDVTQPNPGAKAKALEHIRVISHSNQLLKKYKLNYNNPCVGVNERLMLQNIQDNTQQARELYSFKYYTPPMVNNIIPPLPSRNTKARDYWGYWNGASGNTTLLPEFYDESYRFPGANREPSLSFARVNTLKRINYPTGGSTSFEYELNTYANLFGRNQYKFAEQFYELAVGTYSPPPTSLSDDELYITPTTDLYLWFDFEVSGSVPLGAINSGFAKLHYPSGVSLNLNLNLRASQNQKLFHLQTGNTYKIELVKNSHAGIRCRAYYYQKTQVAEKKAGGLRLKAMTDHDGINAANDITTYYEYEDDNANSSGLVMGHLRFESISFYDPTSCDLQQGGPSYGILTRRASSNIPLITTKGSIVGYSQVTELKGTNGEYGKTIYKYQNGMTNGQPHIDVSLNSPATPPAIPEIPAQENGTLLEKSTFGYSSTSNLFYPVSYETHSYQSRLIPGREAIGIKIGIATSAACPSCNFFSFMQVPSSLRTSWWFKSYSLLRSYDQHDPTRYTEQETHYFYANHTLNPNPTHVYTKTSQDTRWQVQQSKRVVDYISVNNAGTDDMTRALRIMEDKNQISLPVEQMNYYTDIAPPNLPLTDPISSAAELRSSVLNYYRPHQGNAFSVLDEVKVLELDAPRSGYTPSGMSAANTFVPPTNPHFNFTSRVKFTNYNDYGSLLTQKPMPSGQAISYIWGYEETLPIAEVLNLETPNNAAHFNFEEGSAHVGTANSPVNGLLPKTGERFLNVSSLVSSGSGELVHDALDSEGAYILAFWHSGAAGSFNVLSGAASHSFNLPATATGEWKLFETVVSLSNGIVRISFPTGSNYFLDDVRLHPVGTMMKTLTHDPLIGQTSETDAAYKIQYYEYDSLNRLRLIRDQDRNILKRINYKFYNE